MALFSFGVSHKTAPVSIREKVTFSSDLLDEAVESLKRTCQSDEIVIVSTCNRTEIYLSGEDWTLQAALDWLSTQCEIPVIELQKIVYFRQQQDAVKHLMSVACGLDSMVLGEPQILGQLKQAFAQAKNRADVSSLMQRLFQRVFSVAKDVRTNTDIGSSAVSVAFAAVNLAKHIFADLSSSKVLLVGAGETIELVARHIKEAGCQHITVANRTLKRAHDLAEQIGAATATLPEIPELLAHADIVVSSTASSLPIIGKGMVEQALRARRNQPIFMVDIAVPRDIEAQVNDLENVYLYTVDDLQGIVKQNQKQREQAALQALEIIDREVSAFYIWLDSLKSVDDVIRYRERCDETKQQIVQKALNQLKQGSEPEQVLLELANKLTNKLIHPTTLMLRQAANCENTDYIEFITEQLGLDRK